MQFPSIGHFDERIERIHTTAERVRGVRLTTLRWTTSAYRSLRAFLVTTNLDRTFVMGDVQAQCDALRAWVGWLRDHEVSHTGINTYWRGVRCLLRWVGEEDGTVNPLVYLTTPRAARGLPRALTRRDAEAVLAFVQHGPWASPFERARNTAIVALMLFAGLRLSEVVRLRNSDVDTEAGIIRIERSKGQHGGKTRNAYAPPQLRAILSAYAAERHRARRTTISYITRLRTDAGIGVGAINELFRRIRGATGIRVAPHMLRHTYATLLRQAGVADRIAMDLLGHTSLAMLQRYSHVFNGEVADAANRLELDV